VTRVIAIFAEFSRAILHVVEGAVAVPAALAVISVVTLLIAAGAHDSQGPAVWREMTSLEADKAPNVSTRSVTMAGFFADATSFSHSPA
jgi:hypothetical protein